MSELEKQALDIVKQIGILEQEYEYLAKNEAWMSANECRIKIEALKRSRIFIKLLQEAPKIHGWVARDEVGYLVLYPHRPVRIDNEWCCQGKMEFDSLYIPSELYPNLKWEDEPIEVELYLSKKNSNV